jgi:RNA polymerase sigma factor (sigma-70 family)
MRDWNDAELLSAYTNQRLEAAFEVLVERYIALVYSAAQRQVQNLQLADEVTQAVFLILARKSNTLNQRVVLSGWLCRTAHLVARNAVKAECRRQRREQEAYMQSLSDESGSTAWTQLAPMLDEAVAQLSETDRNAVVLRFYERKPLNQVGSVLGVTPDVAQKRVSRAVDKLRKFFSKRGVTLSAAVIAGVVSANSVQAAPVGLATSITAMATKGAVASASTLTLIKGALNIMAWTKIKTAILIGAAVVIVAGTTASVITQNDPNHFPRESWKFAGFADPRSALQSAIWAWGRGDSKTFVESLEPEMRERQRERLEKMKPEDLIQEFRNVTGYRLIGSQTNAVDRVILDVLFNGVERQKDVRLKKVGNEWKLEKIP